MPVNRNSSFFVFQIFTKKRDLLIKKFKKLNIGYSIHYLRPLNAMTYYKSKYKLKQKNFKNSNIYGNTNISLPMYPTLKNFEIDYICRIIRETHEN